MSTAPFRPRTEEIVIYPDDRLETVIQVIRSAEDRLVLSIFKCNERRILDELGRACDRGVTIEAILTARSSERKKKRRRLRKKLERRGVLVHEPRDPEAKYHAKYVVADSRLALIGSLNFTRKCFRRSCDFLLRTADPEMVGAVRRLFEYDCGRDSGPLADFPERIIIAPDAARDRVRDLLLSARRRIAIIDPKLTDPEMIALLRQKLAAGVHVDVLGHDLVGPFPSHGKLLIVDDRVAMIGSLSLSPEGLDARRELAALVTDRKLLADLTQFVRVAVQERPAPPAQVDAAAC
ncbi:MAG: hypothetical protein HY654_04775 [Acidobacteria bacterium]|nr:hypothetical protein [Acidobacteriota bacterium]